MSINGVSNPYQSYAQNGFSRMRNDFKQLGQALQSGSMGAAQQDFSNILQLSKVIQAYHGHHGGETSPVDSASASNPSSAPAQSSSTALSSSSSSSPDNNIAVQSMQSVISQYLSNSIAGGFLGGSGLLSSVLGSINISI